LAFASKKFIALAKILDSPDKKTVLRLKFMSKIRLILVKIVYNTPLSARLTGG